MYTYDQLGWTFFAGFCTCLVLGIVWWVAHVSRAARLKLEAETKRKAQKNNLDYGDPERVDFRTVSTEQLIAMSDTPILSHAEYEAQVTEHLGKVMVDNLVSIRGEIVQIHTTTVIPYVDVGNPGVRHGIVIMGTLVNGPYRDFQLTSLEEIDAPPSWAGLYAKHYHLQWELMDLNAHVKTLEDLPTHGFEKPWRVAQVGGYLKLVVKVFDDEDWIVQGWTGPVLVLEHDTVKGMWPAKPVISIADYYLSLRGPVKDLADNVPEVYLGFNDLAVVIEYLDDVVIKKEAAPL